MRSTAKTQSQDIESAMCARHSEAHELLTDLLNRVDAVDPDAADWGHVAGLTRIVECLRLAAEVEL